MRKLLTGIVAFAIASITSVATVASATFNWNKDPDGSGSLSYGDIVFINQYLAGKYEPSDLSELDMDENDVVSTVDSEAIMMHLAGSLNSVEDIDEPEMISQLTELDNETDYLVYDAQTGDYLREYPLTVTDYDNTNTSGTNQIIGNTDDRIQDWSNRGTAKIMANNIQGYYGTGFVVGNHTIATAAHVVYNTYNNTAHHLTNILLFDSDQTAHSFTPVEIHIPKNYKLAYEPTSDCDYSLITVHEDLSDYMSFNLGVITDTAATNHLTITTAGFPQVLNPLMSNQTTVNSGSEHLEVISLGSILLNETNTFSHNADTTTGQSGSPIYAVETLNGHTYHTVVGIVSRAGDDNSSNIAYRLNSESLKFYKANNSNISY